MYEQLDIFSYIEPQKEHITFNPIEEFAKHGSGFVNGKKRIIDLTGQKFGRLYVESLLDTKHGARFECICDCGNKTIQRGYDLRKGNVVSCGCYQRENASKNMRKWVLNEQT